jgi:hypothetical protein
MFFVSSTSTAGNGIGFRIAAWVNFIGPIPSLNIPSSSTLLYSFYTSEFPTIDDPISEPDPIDELIILEFYLA